MVPKHGWSGPTVVYYWHEGRLSSGTMEGAGICGVLLKCLAFVEAQRGDGASSSGGAGSSSGSDGQRGVERVTGLDVQTDPDYSVKCWDGRAPAEWLVPLWNLILSVRGKLESHGVQVELNWHRRKSFEEAKLADRAAKAAVRRGTSAGTE